MAWHLAKMGKNAGHTLIGIWGRNEESAKLIAEENDSLFFTKMEDTLEADICFISLADHAIESVAANLPTANCLVVHTSGIIPLSVLHHFENHAVCWPCMGMKKGIEADYSRFPFCLEASNGVSLQKLQKFIAPISKKVYVTDTAQRQHLHLAAAFANNFVTLMQRISAELCEAKQLDFEVLLPMMLAHAEKLMSHSPTELQTGVANRGDQEAMRLHKSLLDSDPELLSLYTQLSEAIIKRKPKA